MTKQFILWVAICIATLFVFVALLALQVAIVWLVIQSVKKRKYNPKTKVPSRRP